MTVFVSRRLPPAGDAPLERAGVRTAVGQLDDEAAVPDAVLDRGIAECDVLLCLLTEPIDRRRLEHNPRLLGVANMAVGFNNIDVVAATELGIPVSNTPGVLTETSADLAFALLLATARRLPEADAYTRRGAFRIWGPNAFLGADVGPGPDGRAKTLGIVGYGRIGRAMAQRARGFGMEVLAYGPRRGGIDADPAVRYADLPELLQRSDFVSLHTPLDPSTHHLIGAAELRAMRPEAILINTARGPVVDEAALVTALREGWIRAAGLDVYEAEPALHEGLVDCPNAVLLPHIASASDDTRGAMARMAAENAVAMVRGEPAPNVVNPEVYDLPAYRRRRDR